MCVHRVWHDCIMFMLFTTCGDLRKYDRISESVGVVRVASNIFSENATLTAASWNSKLRLHYVITHIL